MIRSVKEEKKQELQVEKSSCIFDGHSSSVM
jgi:hypothetical protein